VPTQLAAAQLSPAEAQIGVSQRMFDALEAELVKVRRRLASAAWAVRGATVLAQRPCGVGPVTALAFTCWLGGAGRFSPPQGSPVLRA
jgi:hypothetical protein